MTGVWSTADAYSAVGRENETKRGEAPWVAGLGKGRASVVEESRSEVTAMLRQGPAQRGRLEPIARRGLRRRES
jgi:hypothetical protein